jgi:ribosome-associated protein
MSVRARLVSKLGARLTAAGDLVIASDSYRDQPRNREECVRKFQELLRAALRIPRRRKPTRPSRSSVARAAEKKKRHSTKKKLRAAKWD